MNLVSLRIGTGPDFVMMIGKIIYSHRVLVRLAFNSGATIRTPLANASLCTLTKMVRETFSAIGWNRTEKVFWAAQADIAGRTKGTLGTATIRFRFPQHMTKIQQIKIKDEIMTRFL